VSTTFGIPITDEEGQWHESVAEYEDGYYCEVAFQTNCGEIYFTNPLAHLLPDDVKVTALDNDPQGIYTIGDIKREINDNISSKA